MSLSIIVLAAGKGSRMKSPTPKVFHEVGNKPMINHVLDIAFDLKPKIISTVISENLSEHKKSINNKYPSVKFVVQKKRNGTADAVKIALKKIHNIKTKNTLVLYGDTPLIEKKTIQRAIKHYSNKSLDLCVLAMKPDNDNHAYGRLFFEKKKLIKIIEKIEVMENNTQNNSLFNSGMMIFKTKKLLEYIGNIKNLNNKKEFYLTDLVEIFSKNLLSVGFYLCDYYECIGVNTMEELAKTNETFQKKRRKYFLKNGVSMEDPSSVFFSADTKIGKNVRIQPNVYFGPRVVIKNDVYIKGFTHLENTVINSSASAGPFARLRDSVKIGANTKIGNFVELKNSEIKEGVKISHLSYVGDAFIGSNTNIGAGSITCNFDGKNKNKTIIGNDCFIGSNTSLIAPLKINKKSTIGAGTIVNKNIEENSLIYRKSQLIRKKKK